MSSGGTTPAKTDQVSKVELPQWVNDASQSNYKLATDISNRPLEQYAGQTVAAPGAMTGQGYDAILKSLGVTQPLYDKATGMLDKSAGLVDKSGGLYDKAAATLDQTATPLAKAGAAYDASGNLANEAAGVYRGTTGDLNINKYLNPYTDEVEKRAIGNANTALDQRLLQTTDAARKAGAFGGSRHGIESGVTQAEGVRGIGDLSALLRKQGIDFATSTAISDRAGKQAGAAGLLGAASGQAGVGAGQLGVAGGLQNTAAGYGSAGAGTLAGAGAAGNVASGLMNNAAGIQNANQTDIGNLLTAGAQQKTQQQQELDAAMKQFYEKRDYPIEGLNTRLAALGMSPYGKTETTNKTATSEDKGPDWASILLGAGKLGLQAYGMSDRDTKTDIEKVVDGKIPLYAYRYKSDPKTYPKVVGPMAQDVRKVAPSAVKKIGGKLVINYDNLLEALA